MKPNSLTNKIPFPELILMFGLGFALAFLPKLLPILPYLTFKSFEDTEYPSLFSGIFFVVLIVERSLEVLIKAWRSGGKIKLDTEIKFLRKNLQKIRQHPENYSHEQETKYREYLEDKLKEVDDYNNRTRQVSLSFGLILGIFVSFLGVRLIEPLVILDSERINQFQREAFEILDIFLTGTTIAGGSSFFHEIIAVMNDFLITSRRNIQNQNPSNFE